MVTAQTEAREFSATAGFLRHWFVEIILLRHYLVDDIAHDGSGDAGDTKNCGGNDADSCNHAPCHCKCRWGGCAVGCGQGLGIGEQWHGDTSGNEGMNCSMGRQRYLDSNGVLSERGYM